jgi:hypothetical protein
MYEKSGVIASACVQLEIGNNQGVINLLQSKAAFIPIIKQPKHKNERPSSERTNSVKESNSVTKRQYTPFESTCLFITDGFVDRYDGERLVFPGVLRVLSDIFPNDFPYHPNWKSGACHQWYWELFPTVDHIVPVTLGGLDESENWVTTSMFNNLAKSNITLENLGWSIAPRGDFNKWDGLIHWFVKFIGSNPTWLKKSYINNWFKAADKALKANI